MRHFGALLASSLLLGLVVPSSESVASVGTVEKRAFKSLKRAALHDEAKPDLEGYLLGSQSQIVSARNQAMIACTKAEKMGPPRFDLVVELDVEGRIAAVTYYPDTPASRCLAEQLDGVLLPPPPRTVKMLWGTGFSEK